MKTDLEAIEYQISTWWNFVDATNRNDKEMIQWLENLVNCMKKKEELIKEHINPNSFEAQGFPPY